MCQHFDLNFRRGLERLFLMGVDTKDLNRRGGGGVNNKWNGPMCSGTTQLPIICNVYFNIYR